MTSYFDLFLKRRSLTPELIDEYNNPSCDLLRDIDTMAHQLHVLYQQQSKIVVLPDFDTDGIMSAVVGVAGLAELGFNVGLHLPIPSNGYGFGEEDVDCILQMHPDVHTIITCDVGITALSAIDYAQSKGLQVLVTDHHKQLDSDNMHAEIIVDPMRLDEQYRHPEICGAFVFWQVLYYYASVYQSDKCTALYQLRLFAGIGTISDMMPLRYENRQLVKDSLAISQQLFVHQISTGQSTFYTNAFRGFYELIQFLKDQKKIQEIDDITSEFYGFTIAPLFNSLKRMNGDMMNAFGLFFDPQSSTLYAENLILLNEKRKELVKKYSKELRDSEQPFSPFLYLSDAPGGILGLLAQGVMMESHLPVVVLNSETLHGSGRSPAWYLFNTRANENGFYVAGHEGAFGSAVHSLDEAKAFYTFLSYDVPQVYRKAEEIALSFGQQSLMEDPFDLYISTYDATADDTLSPQKLKEFIEQIEILSPFGKGWEKPMVRLTFTFDDVTIQLLGKKKNHLKFSFPNGLDILMWNSAEQFGAFQNAKTFSVVGSLSINEFRGNQTVTMMSNVVIDS